MPNETESMFDARQEAREKLQKAFKPGSPIGAVFIGADSDQDGNTPVLFVNASADVPEIITYSFGTAGLYGDAAELVAADAQVNLDELDEETFFAVAARSVGAAACSSTRVPGVSARSISTRPVMEACKMFAAENRVARIETVSLARSRKLAWKINKVVSPQSRKSRKQDGETNIEEQFGLIEEETGTLF